MRLKEVQEGEEEENEETEDEDDSEEDAEDDTDEVRLPNFLLSSNFFWEIHQHLVANPPFFLFPSSSSLL